MICRFLSLPAGQRKVARALSDAILARVARLNASL
jgi:hypothetical protein